MKNNSAVKLYEYLKEHNHIGKENGISRDDLAREMGICNIRLKQLRREINERKTEVTKLISTSESIYICANREEEREAIINTYKPAISLFLKAKAMERGSQLNGQIKLDLGEDYEDIVNTFERGDK